MVSTSAPPAAPQSRADEVSSTKTPTAQTSADTSVIPFKPMTPREPAVAAPPTPAASVPTPVVASDKIDAPAPVTTASPVISSAPTASLPSLAEAFASLLAAERGRPIAASTVGAPPPVSDQKIEEIVRRVVASMADRTIRDTVVDVAERLVREEIDRIKEGR
jgi:hypothetical protein